NEGWSSIMAVYRIEVRAIHAADDPTGGGVLSEIRQLAVGGGEVTEVLASRVFLLQAAEGLLTPERLERIGSEVLTDPVTETFSVEPSRNAPTAHNGDGHARGHHTAAEGHGGKIIEVHLKPGVMDPVAASSEMAIADLLAESTAGH